MQRRMLSASLSALAAAAALTLPVATASAATTPTAYYLDCAAATDGSGTSAAPWNSLADANAHTFNPGDSLLLDRGTTCSGELAPTGSGTAAAPITLGAYGTGAAPIVNGGAAQTNASAVLIANASNWTITNLEITGGWWRSLFITGDQANTTLTGFKLSNLVVHDNGFAAGVGNGTWVADTGGIVIEPCTSTTALSDISLYNVQIYNGHTVGLQLGHDEKPVYSTADAGSENTPDCHMGLASGVFAPQSGVSNVQVQHAVSHGNDASGIWATGVTGVTIEYSDLYQNGNGGASKLNGEGAWWSNSDNVTAEHNESWGNKWGKGDGGGLDADTYSTDSTIEYNYIHDNDSYCVATFGGASAPTSGVTIEHNLCENNGQNTTAQYEGDLFTWTAGKGTATPSTIADYTAAYNTLIRQNPGPAFYTDSDYAAGTNEFTHNVVEHADGTLLVDILQAGPSLDDNDYWLTGTNPNATFSYNGTSYTTFAAYQTGSGQDANSDFSATADWE